MQEGVVLVLFLLSTTTVGARSGLDPGDGTILPVDVSRGLLHQCSRDAPHDVGGAWLPAVKQIRELESRLPAALKAMASQKGKRFAQSGDFRRQYAGFTIGERKVIYVNAFPRSAGDPSPGRSFDWHDETVLVCDGGPAFFGVEYDPEKGTFDHFEFNGPL